MLPSPDPFLPLSPEFLDNSKFWDSLSYVKERLIDLPLLLQGARPKKREEILEIGCGQGQRAQYLSQKLKAKQYIATDLRPHLITLAEHSQPEKSRVIFQVADPEKLPFEKNKFDLVICMNQLAKQPHWQKILKQLAKVIKPGGKLLIRDVSIETFTLPLVGVALRQIFNYPFEHMFDQKELMIHLQHNGFATVHHIDHPWAFYLVAERVANRES